MVVLNKELYDKIQQWKEENLKDILPAVAIGNAFDKTLKAANKAFWDKLTQKDIDDAVKAAYDNERKIEEEGGVPIMTGSFQEPLIQILGKLSQAPADLREGIFTEYCAECWNNAVDIHKITIIDKYDNDLIGVLVTNAAKEDIEDIIDEIGSGNNHDDYDTELLVEKLKEQGFIAEINYNPSDDDKPLYL